ncbi:hypothetical protein [Amycolatopsis japonica]|uniref:hypothetical protein n=1 Tax=Amycolatopsis japonica TaxID=208439 RepID=UPI003898D7CF
MLNLSPMTLYRAIQAGEFPRYQGPEPHHRPGARNRQHRAGRRDEQQRRRHGRLHHRKLRLRVLRLPRATARCD